jgi:hypothetical protein
MITLDLRAHAVALLALIERDDELRRRFVAVLRDVHGDALVCGREMGIPVRSWRTACRRGEIADARRVGREYRAPRSSVLAWLASRSMPALVAPPASARRPLASTRVDAQHDEFDRALTRARRRTA